MLKFAYLKGLEDVDPFNISGVHGLKEGEQGRGWVYVTVVITLNKSFIVNRKLVTVSLALGEGVACNTIF